MKGRAGAATGGPSGPRVPTDLVDRAPPTARATVCGVSPRAAAFAGSTATSSSGCLGGEVRLHVRQLVVGGEPGDDQVRRLAQRGQVAARDDRLEALDGGPNAATLSCAVPVPYRRSMSPIEPAGDVGRPVLALELDVSGGPGSC